MTAINLQDRKRFIGASESAVLLGISNYRKVYKTPEDLFKQKTNQVEPEVIPPQNQRAIFWGHQLEAPVLDAVPKLYPSFTHVSDKADFYWIDPLVPQMGCSPDAVGNHADEPGPGVIEAKTTGNPNIIPEDGSCPPAWYVQVMHQMACSDGVTPEGEPGYQWGAVACLIQGQDFRLYFLRRDEVMITKIRTAVADFWLAVREWESARGLKNGEPQPETA